MTGTDTPLAITAGEPAGIGPDLCVLLAQEASAVPRIVIGDADCLTARAQQLGLPLQTCRWQPGDTVPSQSGLLAVWHHPLAVPARAGEPDPRNAHAVLATLDSAIAGCLAGSLRAIVTAPLHKGVINDAGIAFTGHTEYLAEQTGTPRVVMMLTGSGLRVALATTHLPLREVADAITAPLLHEILDILHTDLVRRFRIAAPRILVAGLNPHAGESGHLGREEIEIITPALDAARARGMNLIGPLPADTLFTEHQLAGADAVLAMYHDQGLPVLKHRSFGGGINVTLGLPLIRTSVDHGTALDRAGTGHIDSGSLHAALALAWQLA